MRRMRLGPVLGVLGVAVALWCAAAVPVRATYGARTTADEPQYLLSAISLAQDHDLDIHDELTAQRYRAFHEPALPQQTKLLPGGHEVSPHDPLLPLLLAAPVALGGWVGAKLALAAMAGALAAAMAWVAVRRFGVSVPLAVGVVGAFSAAAPLSAYGTQVYPELPAALAVTAAIGAVTGPFGRRGITAFTAAVIALPWLSIKYAPVVIALVAVAVWTLEARGDRRRSLVMLGALAVAGVAYVAFHRVVYHGWTAYAAGDHFAGGELQVIGSSPNYPGRTRRLFGLLVDRGFGLAAWAPVYLLAVPALAALARRRPPGTAVLALPLAAGWLNATFVALTMHGWWWPGRQVVVVLPAAVLAVAWWVQRTPAARPWFALAAVASLVLWAWVVVDGLRHRLALIIDFERTTDPLYQAWRHVLPDHRLATPASIPLDVLWLAVIAALAVAGWRTAAERRVPSTTASRPQEVPA